MPAAPTPASSTTANVQVIGTLEMLVIALLSSIFLLPMAADALLGLAILYLAIKGRHLSAQYRQLWADPLGKLTLLLVVYLCLSVLWSENWNATDLLQTVMRAVLCLCVVSTIANISPTSASFYLPFGKAFTLSVTISAVVCLALWLQHTPEDGRLNGLFRLNNPGKAGRSYAAAVPLLLFACVLLKGYWRALAVLGLLATCSVVFLTDTRAAWLGAYVGGVTLLLATWCSNRRVFLGLASIAGLVSLGFLLVLTFHPDDTVRSSLLPRGDSFRLQIWTDHLQYILQQPLFGGGYMATLEMDLGDVIATGAHNMYLSVAMQIGLPGLLLFAVMTVFAAVRLYRQLHLAIARLALGLLAGSAAFYVFNGDRLLDKVNFIWLATWLPIAIALSLREVQDHSVAVAQAHPASDP